MTKKKLVLTKQAKKQVNVAKAAKFKVGDEVTWESHGTRKVGEIGIAVPPGGDSMTYFKMLRSRNQGVRFRLQLANGERDHKSFIVLVEREQLGLVDVYWPRVVHLRRAG